ncbi:Hsp20 family protein [Zavarzinia sp. CC-PAN008]|uniref:Hsp20 family protein n=1 Tax=Zavarzinia sp. CC-PAN008 TaxID=3243332 RepID=UPI003F746523
MTRVSVFSSPLLLGFDHLERVLDRASRAGNDGYPPYNIERIGPAELRITLAVAGFAKDDLSVTVEDNQLIVRGRQTDDPERVFLHRGIATRQFQKAFVLADGVQITGATIDNGLLSVDLSRPESVTPPRQIAIR